MSTANVSRVGQSNAAGDENGIFLEKFSGRVLMTFEEATLARQRSTVETEEWGKAITISEIGNSTAAMHTVGEEILGSIIKGGEKTIVPEDMLVSSVFVADYDKLLNHFEIQSRYATKLGEAIAERYDRDVFRVFGQAALYSPSGDALDPTAVPANEDADAKSGASVATVSGAADPATDAPSFIALAVKAAEVLDSKNVMDRDNRTLWCTPAMYWLLASAGSDIVNRDFGGEGSIARGLVTRVGNLEIVKSNNFAKILVADQTTVDADTPYVFDAVAADTLALVTTPEAALTGEWLGVTSESGYDIRRQGTLLLSKVVKGSGVLRGECAVNLVATPTP